MTTITTLRLPFAIVEHPAFHDLIQLAQSAPSVPEPVSRKTIQRRLQMISHNRQKSILQSLPPQAKLSISLDCWTSPFCQAFMAVTGYFIDSNWEYREVLLGFEPLSGQHTGLNLGGVLWDILQKYDIEDRILAITTDNASNNSTLVESLYDIHGSFIIRTPCLAHVMQLALKQLLGQMKADPKNEAIETVWSDDLDKSAQKTAKKSGDIATTLQKVGFL